MECDPLIIFDGGSGERLNNLGTWGMNACTSRIIKNQVNIKNFLSFKTISGVFIIKQNTREVFLHFHTLQI